MTEQQIQAKRIKELEAEGYYVIKLMKTNKNGIPDLIAIPPDADVLFSEVKKYNGQLTKLQEYRLKELKSYGFKTEVYKGGDANSGGKSKGHSSKGDNGKRDKQRQAEG